MKDSSSPRLAEACDEDQLLRDVLRVAKEETMTAPRVAQTLARFETTKLQATGQAGAAAKPSSSGRAAFRIGVGASFALVCALSAGLYVRDASTSVPAPPTVAVGVAPSAETAPTPAPAAETTASTRVEDLPVALPPALRSTDERAASVRLASASSAPSAETSAASPAPKASTVSPAPKASTVSPPAKVSAASSFQEQLALLETARSALARGDSSGCLRTLDRYDERFRNGLFSDEIAVMRIEALAARGEHARARSLGDAFLARSPDSTYASRVRSILTTTP